MRIYLVLYSLPSHVIIRLPLYPLSGYSWCMITGSTRVYSLFRENVVTGPWHSGRATLHVARFI